MPLPAFGQEVMPMSLAIDNFLQTLQDRLDHVDDAGGRLGLIADEVAGYYGLRSHEVGLFTVNHRKREISFLLPEGMAKTGHIPLNAVHSLVARTANDLTPSLDNSFATTRHLFMFEHMLAEKSTRITVQRIMSVPIVTDERATGVIQVGRKGATPTEAGPDFTEKDLDDLVRIAAVLARYDLRLS
jgi:hypothetical protein